MSNLTEAVRALRDEIVSTESRLERLRDALRTVMELDGHLPPEVGADRPAEVTKVEMSPAAMDGGRRNVREPILRTLAAGPLTDRELLDRLLATDDGPISNDPLNALRATLSRMTRSGELARSGKAYCLADAKDADGPDLSGPSVSNHLSTVTAADPTAEEVTGPDADRDSDPHPAPLVG